MQPSIDYQTGRDLVSFLSGEYVVSLCAGKAWLYCTCLPADTVSAATQTPDGLLHLFIDLSKPDAHRHAREMVRQWLGVDLRDCVPHLVELTALAA